MTSGFHQILIVEDDCTTREAMGEFLAMHGFAVVLAADGAEALATLRGGLRPCLVLLDLRMPEKNGFQFRVEQVADLRLSTIPVVVYSGDPEAEAEGAILGALANFGKPLDLAKLLEVIETHCQPGHK